MLDALRFSISQTLCSVGSPADGTSTKNNCFIITSIAKQTGAQDIARYLMVRGSCLCIWWRRFWWIQKKLNFMNRLISYAPRLRPTTSSLLQGLLAAMKNHGEVAESKTQQFESEDPQACVNDRRALNRTSAIQEMKTFSNIS